MNETVKRMNSDDNDATRTYEAEMCCLHREKLLVRIQEIFEFSKGESIKPKYVASAVSVHL